MLFTLSQTDLGIVVGAAVIVAVLVYRLMRREPLNRVVRLGLFIERQRFDSEKRRPDSHHLDPENDETQIEWPQREEEP